MSAIFFSGLFFSFGVMLFVVTLAVTLVGTRNYSVNDVSMNKNGIANELSAVAMFFLASIGFMVMAIGIKVLLT